MSTNKALNNKQKNNSRADQLKLYSIGAVCLLLAILLVVNILFDKLLGNAMTFDFSDSGSNTISSETQDFLDSLPSDIKVRIVGLFEKPSNVSGTAYRYIIPLLDDYEKKSDGRISVEYVDPVADPTIISQLDPTNSYDLASENGSFVLQYNGSIRVIAPIDCYYWDQDYYFTNGDYLITGNNTDFVFANNINILIQGYKCNAYVVSGLKIEGNSCITKILESMSFKVSEIAAAESFTIPEDCDLLILNGPNTDISENMLVAMTDYVKNGGKMLIAVDCSADSVGESFERLNQLVNVMNLSIDNTLITENDPGYQLGGSLIDSTVVINDQFSDYVSIRYLQATYARPVRVFNESDNSIFTLPVLSTSSNASAHHYNSDGVVTDGNIDTTGTYNVAMYASNDVAEPSKMFVFGTLDFTSDAYINAYGLNCSNVDFLRSCVEELTSTNSLPTINVPSKVVDNFSIDSTSATVKQSTAILIVFMIVLPVLLLSMAVIVYTKRKNL